MEQKQPSGPPQGRQKMNYACEACRAAKTKCQSGPQPEICKRYHDGHPLPPFHPLLAVCNLRCSEFKRECIFRTGPRTRRPKAAMRANSEAAALLPPPPGPSKTFSIDFQMPVAEEPNGDFDGLRQQHEHFLDILVSDSEDEDEQQVNEDIPSLASNNMPKSQTFSFNDMSSSPSVSLSGMNSSWTESSAESLAKQKSKPMLNLGIKPQFNLDSATKLLASFRHMVPHLPCLVLPEDADVRSLSRRSPFVLLAILAVTSCSSSLQGHSLYDEEFRKVLGLKFVAGGERSLELLQGVLIYCSWYPFHLRPKNKQSYQYLRMAVDIVHDLEMEQAPDLDLLYSAGPDQRARKLDDIRALLGCYYAMSTFAVTWGKSIPNLRYSPELTRCAEALEQNSELEQDHHLVWLVRLQYVFEQLIVSQRNWEQGPRDHQSEVQRNLIRAGLAAQFREFKQRMPEQYISNTSILLLSHLTEAFTLAAPIFRIPRKFLKDGAEIVSPDRLLLAAHIARAVFDHVTSLPPQELGGLSSADYGRFIVAVIITYRLSFPMLAICRNYDVAQGRRVLDLGEMLRRLIGAPNDEAQEEGNSKGKGAQKGSPAVIRKPKKSDAVSALRVVLQSVKLKFEEKSAALEAMPSAAARDEMSTRDFGSICPMLNGSMDQYIPLWSGQQSTASYATSHASSSAVMTAALSSSAGIDSSNPFLGPIGQMGLGTGVFEDKTLMYHDLWATMTMGWAGDMGEINMEDIGNTGYGDMLDQV
ncbi:hypothetical protein F4860DRAFT_511910 [Xylaria cubensis]|nr:hypothetical protein F4860DRAFT_511910 [Xylaria cubensis]